MHSTGINIYIHVTGKRVIILVLKHSETPSINYSIWTLCPIVWRFEIGYFSISIGMMHSTKIIRFTIYFQWSLEQMFLSTETEDLTFMLPNLIENSFVGHTNIMCHSIMYVNYALLIWKCRKQWLNFDSMRQNWQFTPYIRTEITNWGIIWSYSYRNTIFVNHVVCSWLLMEMISANVWSAWWMCCM